MGGSLKKLVISATGEFGSGKSHDQLKKWVDANGGKWCPKINSGTTHLICSKDAWKKQVDAVINAKEVGAQIVSYDWLEDSLMSKKKLAEKKYTWDKLSKERKDKKTIKRTAEKFDALKFKQGNDQAQEDLGTGKAKPKLKSRSKTSSSASSTHQKPASRASASSTPTRPAKNGFFKSSIAELKKKREEREALEKAAVKDVQATSKNDLEHETAMDLDDISTNKSNTDDKSESGEGSGEEEMEDVQEGPVDLEQGLQDLYHLYQDNTGFEYTITLVRSNFLTNSNARYVIRLYESNTTPHTYRTFLRYWPAGRAEYENKAHIPLLTTKDGPLYPKTTTTEVNGKTGFEKQIDADQVQQPNPIAVPVQHANAIATITPTPPSAHTPFRTLLTPQNADYKTAFRAFRHAFQDLTLLPWHLRLASNARALQTQRAIEVNTEPFIFTPPLQGLPMGTLPNPGLPMPEEEGYVRGALGLPGMVDVGLDKTGLVGGAVAREEERKRKDAEDAKKKIKMEELDAVKARLGIGGGGRKRTMSDKRDYFVGARQYRSR